METADEAFAWCWTSVLVLSPSQRACGEREGGTFTQSLALID